jgi:hypothetical protein
MNYYNVELKRWFVLGVAGRGETSDCNSSHKPINVFTRVGNRLDFIRDYSGVVPPIENVYTTTPEGGNITETTTEISSTTVTTTTEKPIAFCMGKTDGNYPNPASSCSTNFYTCSHGSDNLTVSFRLINNYTTVGE